MTTKSVATKEAAVTRKITKILTSSGPHVIHYRPVPSQWGGRHVDYIANVYGIYTLIEAKRPGLHPTVIQAQRLQEAIDAGGCAMWLDGTVDGSGDIAHLEAWIKHAREAFLAGVRPIIPEPNWLY
jgi:hypothetical protein